MDLAQRRRFFAEEIEAVAHLRTAGLVEAFASVPRERFLPPGPWILKSEGDVGGPPRQTPDADPRRIYHNLGVGIVPSRQLFNGSPSLLGMCIDALALTPGARVLHVGCGLGYYTALMAHCVGSSGRVVTVEIDADLAAGARANLASMPWVEVRQGDATAPLGEVFDAVLINAGATHPQAAWLDALAPDGRLIFPLTVPMPAIGPTIGKGVMLLIGASGGNGLDPRPLTARILTFVAIYLGVGLCDPALNARIGEALQRNPFPRLKHLRRDRHEPSTECWLHWDTFCLSA